MSENKIEDWLPVEEAAQISGYHPNHIRRLVRAKAIRGQKWGKVAWMISRQSLLDYMKSSEAKGERRGPKTGSRQIP